VEELRTLAQHQLAVHPSSIFGCAAQEIVNTLLRQYRSGNAARMANMR
jgi:hypothetical protein